MKIVRLRGKKWELPEVLPIDENAPYYFWQEIDFRKPLKGEYFVSGGPPSIYKTNNDLSQKYLVVTLLKKAVRKTIWV